MSPVAISGVDKQGVDVNGVQVKQALNPANSTVNKGVYNATLLETVDVDLAVANIKSGVTIFGVAGSASVLDVSDADALVTDVKSPKTFYSVTGPRKTGTMATVALAPGSSAYPAGYHAGDGGGLPAIDADLAAANIKTGITIFGLLGTYDTTGSPPVAGDMKTGKVAWANGVQITGTMATVALDPALNAYPAGYHAGAASLTAVDADLVTGSIKSGVTIFGVAGAATVQDISAANAVVGEVLNPKTFFSVTGAIKTGTMPTVAITAANDNYPAGYHAGDVGGLDAIDLDLASANIKSGVTIFGKAGAATVQEIGAADAAVTDVKAPRTFFSVTGGIKTGTLATVALGPAANAYPAGYHVGAASLTAVDADLAAANIKTGITIFGVLGTYDTTASAPAAGQVILNKVCWANGVQITGTMATVALAPALNAYPAGYHVGAASLTAVDADLAAANIKSGVTIFGVLGTYAGTPSQDLVNVTLSTITSPDSFELFYTKLYNLAAGTETTLATTTQNFAANSLAIGLAYAWCMEVAVATDAVLRLYMDGVLMGQTAEIPMSMTNQYVIATKAMVGNKVCETRMYNGGAERYRICGHNNGSLVSAIIVVGSVKVT